jgi:hypothetical protein
MQPTPDFFEHQAASSPSIQSLTLISDAFSVDTEPDNGRLLTRINQTDSVTINTDLIGYVSKDGGSTWDEVTLSEEGKAGGLTVYAGTQALSSTGTSIAYKLETTETALEVHDTAIMGD